MSTIPHDDEHDPELAPATSPQHAAYAGADSVEFNGKPLKAFGPKRQIAAQYIGLKFWSLSAADIAAATKKDGAETSLVYDGMFFDVVLVTYLCLCPDSDVLKAVRQPDQVAARAQQWAEDEGITFTSPKFVDACTCFGQIIAGITNSAAEPVPDKEAGSSSGNG